MATRTAAVSEGLSRNTVRQSSRCANKDIVGGPPVQWRDTASFDATQASKSVAGLIARMLHDSPAGAVHSRGHRPEGAFGRERRFEGGAQGGGGGRLRGKAAAG